MNHKALLAGVFVAITGFVLLFFYMRRYEAEASGGAPVEILMVRQDLPLGQPVTAESLAIRQMPTAYVEDRHVRAADQDRILGIRAAHGLRANQALLWTDLATAVEGRRDLSELLRRGMRAITIQVDRRDALVTLLRPGDRVDLLYTGTRPGAEEDGQITISLLQNILVLAVGQDTGGQGVDQSTERQSDVSVGVTIEQAALLTHAMTSGDIELTLRNPTDIQIVEGLEDVTNSHLIEPAQRQQVQRTRRRTTQGIENVQ
ncbi:MAG: pilus assembly protein CpaB [Polyangiales bacterium]|jgi:pilus assembly protein CpaB